MKHLLPILCLALGLGNLAPAQRTNFDVGWKFSLGHASDPRLDFGYSEGGFSAFAKAGTDAGPISLGFDDTAWRTIDLPHDWAIELPFDPKADHNHGFKPVGRAFPQNSVGWYRKSFEVAKTDAGQRFRLTFDGIYRDSDVWINGHYLGHNASGYIGNTYDLSDYVKYGTRNVISVRVDASHFEGWFYEGAGIYRHAWLTKSPPAHLVEDGVMIKTHLGRVNELSVTAEVQNSQEATAKAQLNVTLRDAQGKIVGSTRSETTALASFEMAPLTASMKVANPHLWSPEDPYLYTAEISVGGDKIVRNVGFRTFAFDKDRGFLLNGKVTPIQGTCNHQDHAGVGAAIPDRLNEWRIAQLKKIGCNFYRTSHNPPTPELLDACDRLGMMVLDETRMFGSEGEALSQLSRLIRRDRSHPSVIFYSIGNEEWGTQGSAESARIAQTMMRAVRAIDPTRPVTFAANNGGELTGINSVVDIRGFNYNLGALDAYRKARPDQPLHGSEVASTVTTRGEYVSDPVKAYVNSYDTQKIGWGTSAEEWWRIKLARSWFEGGFVWTGFDYRGEPTPYTWPNISSHFGILDTCGFPKDVAFYYQAWWTNTPTLHVFPHWNWSKPGQVVDVWVFANHEEVELSLNGKSLGRQKVTAGGHVEWKVPYAPGTLVATGYRGGKLAQTTTLSTTGPAAKLIFETDHSSVQVGGADVAVINVKAVDAEGRVVPDASQLLSFEVEGEGRILGVGNGDPSSHEADKYLPTQNTISLDRWKFATISGSPENRPEVKPEFDDSKWKLGSASDYQLTESGAAGVFRTTFEVADPALYPTINVSPIDDDGWVYLNGQLLGTTHEWNTAHRFSLKGNLRKGTNAVAIVAVNRGGQGGFRCRASLEGPETDPVWTRSLFHGYAQVIVKSGRRPGVIKVRATAPGCQPAEITIQSVDKS